jgi:putative zincin peptidase
MVSATKQLPTNYVAHSALNFGSKGWARTLLNLASFLVWLVCSVLLLWIVVRFRPDAGEDTPVFGQAEGLVSGIVVLILLFGVAAVLHQTIHGVSYWMVTRERPRLGMSGRYLTVSVPGWCFTKLAYTLMLLAPLVVWLSVTVTAIAFVPAPTVYWVAVALALNIALCAGDLLAIVWTLRQPRGALFKDNDDGIGTTAYVSTI